MDPVQILAFIEMSSGSPADDIRRFIGDQTVGASYQIASLTMKIVSWILSIFGLEYNQTLVTFFYAAVVLGVALVVGVWK